MSLNPIVTEYIFATMCFKPR